jgi:sialic acid synthase SpsE
MAEQIVIGERKVGSGCPVYIIAEVGCNHDASLERAKELARAASEAGADAVKFQSFTAEGLLNPLKPDDDGNWIEHPAYEVLQKLSLPAKWHYELKRYCDELKIDFLSAPFDIGRADLLHMVGIPAFKIASGDITYVQLLRKVASFGKPVILSTGASYLEEVDEAVKVIMEEGNSQIALMHCVSLYPAKIEDANLKSITTMKKAWGVPVGLSDHSPGSLLAIAAVSLGASIIEKHITFSRELGGPDHSYAMEIEEFKEMVDDIRLLEGALGGGIKKPTEEEMDERIGARRSIYLRKDVAEGTVLTTDLFKIVRHGHGMEPRELSGVIGMEAVRDLKVNMPLCCDDISEPDGTGEQGADSKEPDLVKG